MDMAAFFGKQFTHFKVSRYIKLHKIIPVALVYPFAPMYQSRPYVCLPK